MKGKYLALLIFSWLVFGFLVLEIFFPFLQQKIYAQSKDLTVSFQADFNDVMKFSLREKIPIEILLNSLHRIPVHVVSLGAENSKETEDLIRQIGFRILWRQKQVKGMDPTLVLNRMRPGDGVLAYEDVALGYPNHLNDVVAAIQKNNGFVPWFEFASQKGLAFIAEHSVNHVVRGHCIKEKEVITPKLRLWENRIIRAVKLRWIRLLEIRFSPAMTWKENLDFQNSIAHKLKTADFSFGPPEASAFFKTQVYSGPTPLGDNLKLRIFLIIFFSILTPILEIMFLKHIRLSSPWILFAGVSLLSIFSGIIIQALGSHPYLIFGMVFLPGIKIQLLLPLLIGFGLLVSKDNLSQWKKINSNPLALGLIGGGIALVIGIYLMRSGNHPLLPVLDIERTFRDFLENSLGSRPRFKEFLIGHPALMVGLWLKSKKKEMCNFFNSGNFWIGLGLIGQISIINTFEHFNAPFYSELARTQNGLIIGFILGLMIIVFLRQTRWGKI